MLLEDIGWNDYFKALFELSKIENSFPARIACEQKNLYTIFCEAGELLGEVSGKFKHDAGSRADFPAVGDWVVVTPRPNDNRATIHSLLPRKTVFSRKAILGGGPAYGLGRTEEQILTANIDSVFLVSGLDGDFNLRRIERYLSVAWDSGAVPIIVLNKSDLSENIEIQIEQVEGIALGVLIYPVSAKNNQGMESLIEHIGKGKTVTFLGSSGVGKSSIINCLLGNDQLVIGELRKSDGRGRHTTTYREMLLLPNGGIVIDTPGMREIQVWTDSDGMERTFSDIEELANRCRFRDCNHATEPGCAIMKALDDGTLDKKRYNNYLRLQKEVRHLKLRQDQKEARRISREWDKKIRQHHKNMKELRKRGLA